MQAQNSDTPTFGEKFRRVIDSELTGQVWRFFKGTALFSAMPAFGLGGLVLVGAALIGLSVYRNHLIATNHRRDLLKQYKSDVAAAVGKEASEVTLDDLSLAAQQINGGHNAIQDTLDKLKHNYRINITTSLIGGVVTTALAAAAPAVLSTEFMRWFGGALIGGAASNIAYFLVEEAVQKVTGEYRPYRSNHSIKAISQQSKVSSVSPEQVMQAFVEAQPRLAEQIREYYQRSYADLSFKDKREVVSRYRDIVPAKEWADEINSGRKSPNALAADAYNTLALPATMPLLMPPAAANFALQQPDYSFAAKIDEQRAANLSKAQLLH